MKLPIPQLFGKKKTADYFLVLLLRDEKANAVIVEQNLGKIRVIGEYEEYFKDSVESENTDAFLQVLDKAISTAESTLPQNVETKKTIFGVKETWVEDAKIKRHYLTLLKKASDNLGLVPIGFLVIHEAIAHFLQQEEGAPVTAILVEVAKHDITISIIRGGRIVETKRADIETSISTSVDKLLHNFTTEVLPSRIILFNGKENETLSQEFITHSWSKSLPFLHVPQPTVLPGGFDAQAVVFGAAKQMGFDVLSTKPAREEFIERPAQKTEEISQDETKDASDLPDEETFGFLKEKDVLSSETQTPEEEEEEEEEEEILNESNIQPVKQHEVPLYKKILTNVKNLIPKIMTIFPRVPKKTNTDQHPRQHEPEEKQTRANPAFKNKKTFVILLLPLALIILYFVFPLLFLKATITVAIQPKIAEKKQDVTISAEKDTDFTKNIIGASTVSITEDGSATASTTGTKEIGDNAKGKVTIYNSNLTSEQSIAKDSTITAPNGVVFTLDSDVNIASASGDASSIQSSTASVSVTARDIGKESNLPSGTKFTVGTFDATVIAKNDSAFSGGSKQDITVVAKADQDKLASQIISNLEIKAKDDLGKKANQDTIPLPLFLDETLTKKTFNKAVGDEATSVTITGSVSYKTIAYQKSVVEDFAKKMLEESINDMKVSGNGISFDLQNTKAQKGQTTTATLHAKAALVPQFTEQNIVDQIAGKTTNDATDTIKKLPQVSSVTITFSPNIPIFPKILPKRKEYIHIIFENND